MLYFEDQPLDLSVKSRNIGRPDSYSAVEVHGGGLSPLFNFTEFYKTYLEISQKSLDIYYSQQALLQSQRPELSKTAVRAKRKLSNDFDASESKKVRRECIEEENVLLSQTKRTKILRRKKREQMTEIGQSCDCRGCYEEHIRTLRLKMDVPWPLLS